MINAAQFRHDYPEFGDASRYPNSAILFYLNWVFQFQNTYRWGASAFDCWPAQPVTKIGVLQPYDLGAELLVAHSLALSDQQQQDAEAGNTPGLSKGVLNHEQVDKASAGYDVAASMEPDGGWYNLTVYGTRYLRLLRQAGAGGLYIGIGFNPNPNDNGPAWPGPWPFPSPTGFSS